MIGLFALTASIFGADFIIKKKMDETLEEGEEREILNGKVVLTKHYNQGFAMNAGKDKPKLVKAIHLGVAIIFLLCYTLIVRDKGSKVKKVGSAMVLGGGLSNLFDRLTKGHVVDYVRVPVKKCSWLSKIIFNFSDVMIFIGAILLLFGREKKEE